MYQYLYMQVSLNNTSDILVLTLSILLMVQIIVALYQCDTDAI